MRYGLALSAIGECGEPTTMAKLAVEAEQAGWDGLFVEDYVFFHDPELPAYDPWIVLAASAMATTRIVLGTGVTPVARRRVWKLASEVMTLDRLSGGRVVLGVGLGDEGSKDFAGVGEPPDSRHRAEVLDESLEVLSLLWSGEEVTYSGRHLSLDAVKLAATPVQTPRVPIWVGGCAALEGPRRRALRWDGSFLYRVKPPEWQDMSADDVIALRREADAVGNDAFVIAVGGRSRRADLGAESEYVTSLDEAGADWWCEYVQPRSTLTQARDLVAGGPIRSERVVGS